MLRAGLPALPNRMKRLPVDHRGFPVPWFVAWFDDGEPAEPGVGVPDFRVIDPPKIAVAVKRQRCWTCGEALGVHLAFVIGPMCAVNRVISEPPSHRDCAIFSATACPFLSQPRMRRNEVGIPGAIDAGELKEAAGFGLKRNPGAACVWITRSYRVFKPHAGAPGVLFQLGDPEEVLWFARGREATRAEVVESIERGLPLLGAQEEGPEAEKALAVLVAKALPLLPRACPDAAA